MSAVSERPVPRDSVPVRRRVPDRLTVAVALALLVPPALTLLWWPQTGDQTLFQVGGRMIADGGVYWRDFWDVKQPGIFWLYGLSERLGAGVLGVRLLEMAAALAAGVLVLLIVRGWSRSRTVLVFSPLLVVAPYLLAAASNGVGQVEGLVTLPLLAAYAAGQRAATAPSTRTAAGSGVVLGVATTAVAAMKVLYLPVVAGVVLAAVLGARPSAGHGQRVGRGRLAATSAVAAAGVVAVLGGLWFVDLARDGIVGLAWWSTGAAPREELATGLFDSGEALRAVMRLAVAGSVTGPLAALALVAAMRRGLRRAPREVGLVAWFVTAAAVSAPQLPTTYRALFLLPPLGLLAVLGLDQLLDRVRDRRPVTTVAFAVAALALTFPLLLPTTRLAALLVTGGPAVRSLSDPARLAVGDRLGGSPMVGPAGLMRDRVRPGTAIYVLGDPVVYRVLEARQGIEMNGWGPEVMSPRMWREIARELDRSRPEWVLVQTNYQADVDTAPEVTAVLRRWYRPVEVPGGAGTWWHTTSPGVAPPTPDGNQVASHA